MENFLALLAFIPALFMVIKIYRSDISYENITLHLFIAIILGILCSLSIIFQNEFFQNISIDKIISGNFLLSTYLSKSLAITIIEQVALSTALLIIFVFSFKNDSLTLKDGLTLSIYLFIGFAIGKCLLLFGHLGFEEVLIQSIKIIPTYFVLGSVNGYLAGIVSSYISSRLLEKLYIKHEIISGYPLLNYRLAIFGYFIISLFMEILYYLCLFIHSWIAILVFLVIEIGLFILFYRYYNKISKNRYNNNFPLFIALFINAHEEYQIIDLEYDKLSKL